MSSNIFNTNADNSKSIEKTLTQTDQSHPPPKNNSNSPTVLACETPPPLDFDGPSHRPEYSSPIPPNTLREKNVRDHLMIISENLLEIQESLKEITKMTGIEL